MGRFCPVLLAFLLNCFGVSIFRDKQTNQGCEPLVSCLIFLFAVFLLLWDMRLYPLYLRKLWSCAAKFVEFLIAMFLMEHIMADFWFPLDTAVILFLKKVPDYEKDALAHGGWNGDGIFQFLRNDVFGVITSYILSIFFLCCVMHATRIVDFRLLRCGFPIFLTDIKLRFKRYWQETGCSEIHMTMAEFCRNRACAQNLSGGGVGAGRKATRRRTTRK